MKPFLKTASLLLTICMLALTCCACAKNTPTTPETPAQSTPSTPTPSCKPQIDETFGGETVKFFATGGEGSVQARSISLSDKDDPENEINAAIKRRNEIVEEELGVKIELSGTCGMTEAAKILKPVLLAHTGDYDVIGLFQYYDIDLVLGDTAGAFYSYDRMPDGKSYIDLDAPYWDRAISDASTMYDAPYDKCYATGDLCLETNRTMMVSYVNAALWEEFKKQIRHFENNPEGLDDVYEIVRKGYWTMDFWTELAKVGYKDLNSNDCKDYEDQAGVMTYTKSLWNTMVDCFAAGAHVLYSEADSNGKRVITLNSEHNLTFTEKLYTLLCESDAVALPYFDERDVGKGYNLMDFFASGKVLATVNVLGCAEEYLSEMKDDYYILPLPLLDRSQYDASSASLGYSTQYGDSISLYAVCKDAGDERLPAITATMELMAYYSMTDVRSVLYDNALKGRYVSSPADREMLDLIRAGVYGDFVVIWSKSLDDFTRFFRQNYDLKGSKLSTAIKKEVKNCKEKLKKLYEIEGFYYVEETP